MHQTGFSCTNVLIFMVTPGRKEPVGFYLWNITGFRGHQVEATIRNVGCLSIFCLYLLMGSMAQAFSCGLKRKLLTLKI